MSKVKHDSSYVTHAQCSESMSPIVDDLKTIKNALVGQDLRGGLVNQVSTITTKLDQVISQVNEANHNAKNEKKEKKEISLRWKLAAFSAIGAILGILIGHLLDLIL